jgi:transcriptional regulator with XRE-family HTH domain
MPQNNIRLRLKMAILADKRRTQEEIARAAGLHPTTLSQIVQGRIIPTREEEVAIAKALHLPPDRLFSQLSEAEIAGFFFGSQKAEELHKMRRTQRPEED